MRKAIPITTLLAVTAVLGGCSTMTATQKVSAVTRPMSAPMMAQSAAPVVAPQGLDFSSAVAMIANTPGTGVTMAGGKAPTQAMALVAPTIDRAVTRPYPPASRPAARPVVPKAAEPAPALPSPAETATVACKDPAATVATPGCPVTTPAVRRF